MIILETKAHNKRTRYIGKKNKDVMSFSESEGRFLPHGSVISLSPLSCAGLTTNILIVFTLTGTLGAAEERPALALLQSWNHSNRRANL